MRLILLAVVFAVWLAAQSPSVVAVDPNFAQIVSPTAKIEKLAGNMKFTEGPVWMGDHLLFTDIPNNAIMKWTPGGQLTAFRKPVFPGKYEEGQFVGANGLTLDKSGRLTSCEHSNRRVARTEKDGKITVLADKYEGKRLNTTNDLAIGRDGSVYFTDAVTQRLWHLNAEGKVLSRWETANDLRAPSGIALDRFENVFVAGANGVGVFSNEGELLFMSNEGLSSAIALAFDKRNRLYVLSAKPARVLRFEVKY